MKSVTPGHPAPLGATVTDAFVVNDSGYLGSLTVQIANLTLNSTVYTHPGNATL